MAKKAQTPAVDQRDSKFPAASTCPPSMIRRKRSRAPIGPPESPVRLRTLVPFRSIRRFARFRSVALERNQPVMVNWLSEDAELKDARNALGPTKPLPMPVAEFKSSARSAGSPETPEPDAPHNPDVGLPKASLRDSESGTEPELAAVVPKPSLNW